MKKRNVKHEKRVKKLIVACGLCAIILTVSTYAWFIGMKKVNVKAFEVSIAAADNLSLSLDGKTFSDEVTISKETVSPEDYPSNTNSWGGDAGLVPMSSVGQIDTAKSRLILYEKGSFTATDGGYRVMASRAENEGATEARGYVAFDLFIKNLSGEEYYEEFNIANEEAIYLTPESEVKIADAGSNKGNSGIENSVRVGFAQIGRVKADTDYTTIQGIDCAGTGGSVSICSRQAQIWEPNDTKHVQNAINWYNKSCKKRTGSDITKDGAYTEEPCGTIEDGTPYPTYAVSGVIGWENHVDVYDGTEFNGYTNSINSTAQAGKLVKGSYFTDSMKDKKGTERPEFMRLAPNSVTKVRVYVWIEGQDVDNYDFASLGKKISVTFGFTKERYYGEDVDYDGNPELPKGFDKRPTKSE